MTTLDDDIFEHMRNEIEKMLNSKTAEVWTVTCDSEHLDFQFTAKTEIAEGKEQYGVRSASFSVLDLSKVTIPLMITNTVQMMLSHFNRAKELLNDGTIHAGFEALHVNKQ